MTFPASQTIAQLPLLLMVSPPVDGLVEAGDQGDMVAHLQTILVHLGFYDGPVDGVYGPGTVAAVVAFQQQHDLNGDGIVGARTWQALAIAQVPQSALQSLTTVNAQTLDFTPMTFNHGTPPPSPLWLVLMPLIPLIGGGLTYLYHQWHHRRSASVLQRHQPPKKRKKNPMA
ncbi:MAG: peptidoglycan-binding protein [Leptolyngbya sp. LCM1.Bin17]|nr:MAG: peptidoglycan-binding protein [Leptolyngbya sp. LCM1.Bin17]